VAWRGVAKRGVAWRGVAKRGVAWRGVAWRGVAWRGVDPASGAPDILTCDDLGPSLTRFRNSRNQNFLWSFARSFSHFYIKG
jgi:hypothetical protein